MPYLSVIIPLYNKELYIKDAIDSVLQQSFRDYEILVVNDGSIDRSLEIVNSISDSRIRVVNQINSGVSAARNKGIELAYGKYLFFLDADDVILPGALDLFNNKSLLDKNIDLYALSYIEKNSNGDIVANNLNQEEGILTDVYKSIYLKKVFIRTGSFFVKKSVVNRTAPLLLDLCLYEDMEWIHRLLENSVVYSSKQIILEYIRGDLGLSRVLPNIKSDFAGVATIKSVVPKYRRLIIGDFIFRSLCVRIKNKDKQGVCVILKNNRFSLLYIVFSFIQRVICTKSIHSWR